MRKTWLYKEVRRTAGRKIPKQMNIQARTRSRKPENPNVYSQKKMNTKLAPLKMK